MGRIGHGNMLETLALSCYPLILGPFSRSVLNVCDCSVFPTTELYSYTENLEFTTNRRCFEEDFKTQGDS